MKMVRISHDELEELSMMTEKAQKTLGKMMNRLEEWCEDAGEEDYAGEEMGMRDEYEDETRMNRSVGYRGGSRGGMRGGMRRGRGGYRNNMYY